MSNLYNKVLSLYNRLLPATKTQQVTGLAKHVVYDRELSNQIYDAIDDSQTSFVITKGTKKYRVKRLR